MFVLFSLHSSKAKASGLVPNKHDCIDDEKKDYTEELKLLLGAIKVGEGEGEGFWCSHSSYDHHYERIKLLLWWLMLLHGTSNLNLKFLKTY